MYKLGKPLRHYRRLGRTVLVVLTIGLLAAGCYQLLHLHVKPKASIHNSPPRTSTYTAMPANMHIDEPLFTVDLPSGWQPFTLPTDLAPPAYSFRSGGQHTQILSIYLDTIPASLAVNRAVAVTAQGSGMAYGDVSDNCSAFTRPDPSDPGSGVADGVWQGKSFICDLGNYERDVVGIASAAGINQVKLTGHTAGTHAVFLAYTDNGIKPDFSTLYGILRSFKLK